MRRVLFLVVGVLLGAAMPLIAAWPALACSCTEISPSAIEFEGEPLGTPATRTAPWRFRVASGRGVEKGDVVTVHLDVAYQYPDGAMEESSCALGDAPTAGQRYRLGASAFDVDGRRVYSASQCGGYFELATGLSHHRPASRPPVALVVFVALAILGAVVVSVRDARRPA